MTSQDVRTLLSLEDDANYIRLSMYGWITVDKFAEIFEAAPAKPTYDDLMAIDRGELGYEETFSRWKEQGIIS